MPTNSLRATRLRKTMQIAKFPNPKREAIIITGKGRYSFFEVLPKSDFLKNHCSASIEQVVFKKDTTEKLKIRYFELQTNQGYSSKKVQTRCLCVFKNSTRRDDSNQQ